MDPDTDATEVALSGIDSNLADLSSSTVTFSNAISETEDSVTTYTISEKDAFELSLIASETLNASGETSASGSVVSKSYTEKFFVLESAREATFIAPDDLDYTYTVNSGTSQAGDFGTLTIDQDSGAYTYSTDSDLQAFLDLQAGAVVYDGFLVNAVAASGESYNQVLVFDLQKLGISAPTIDTLVEGNEVNSFSGTLQTEGLYAGSTGTFEIEGGRHWDFGEGRNLWSANT